MTLSLANLEILILVVVRLLAFMVVSPVFDNRSIPPPAKIFLAILLGMSVTGSVFGGLEPISMSGAWFTLYLVRETLLGLALGFVTRLVFTTVQVAGQLVDFQIGFSISATFNPMAGATQAIMGRIYSMVTLVLIFVTDTHHQVIHALVRSFELIPLGTSVGDVLRIEMVMHLMVRMFALAFQIAAPVILVLIMVDIVMGILSKTVPQLNILMLGMPMKILVGTLMIMTIFPVIATGLWQVVREMIGYLERILAMFG